MLRKFLFMAIALLLTKAIPVQASVLPEDCSGVNAQSEECVRMLSMASYVEQAKAQAERGDYSTAIDTMGQAIKIAKTFHPELYIEYVIDQAGYAEDWARDIKGIKGLDQALAILQRAIPHLRNVENVSVRAHFYNRIGGIYVRLGEIKNNSAFTEAAIESFQHILSIIDKKVDVTYWANIQLNLGQAYAAHYENTKDAGQLIIGKMTLQEAQKHFDKKTQVKEWATVTSALADSDATAAVVYNRTDLAQAALDRYSEIAQALSGSKYKNELANAYHNGALVSMRLGRETDNLDHLKSAYTYFGKATDLFEESRNYFSWVTAYSNQAWSLFYGAKITKEIKHYENAVKMVQNILDSFPQHKSPDLWAALVNQLGDLQMGLAVQKEDVSVAKQAMRSFKISKKVYEEEGDIEQQNLIQEKILEIEAILQLDDLTDEELQSTSPSDTGI